MDHKRNIRAADLPGEAVKRRKIIACERCHSHKIKCSGDQPCTKCRSVGCADECRYPARDRQVKVSESAIGFLGKHPEARPGAAPDHPSPGADGPNGIENEDEASTSVQNPIDPSAPPIFVGEAACTAFATRFRQFLTKSSTTVHIRRTQYVKEENITLANAGEIRWPSLQQARLLVQIANRQISCIYHVLLRKSTLEKLEEIYRTGDFKCTVNQCKFFALFAFGEAYPMRSEPASGSRVPGTSYFARSLSLVQVLPERTSITHLETLLLLSLFYYYLNRRHSAYVLIGSAMCLGLCIGLNHNIPESQLIDPIEHDDIHLDMPSSTLPKQIYEEQFTDAEYIKSNINLARIVGETTAKVYSRHKYNDTFLQRVQKLLKALKSWVDTLPEHLRLNVGDPEMNTKQVTSIHLAFNQLLQTLGEACIHAARHSHSLILTKWVKGSLPVFGYFHAHYLFSYSLVLAMSAFVPLPLGSPADLNAFETGLEVLASMSENGNLAANEFYHNLERVRVIGSGSASHNGGCQSQRQGPFGAATGPSAPLSPSSCLVRPAEQRQNSIPATISGPIPGLLPTYNNTSTIPPNPNPNPTSSVPSTIHGHDSTQSQAQERVSGGFTTAMAFMEPTMQEFLAQTDLDLGLLNPVETFMDHVEGLYSGHGFS
ncbi:hypothetical protein BDW68DRAFT_187861 [Aspergillus falconensis]